MLTLGDHVSLLVRLRPEAIDDGERGTMADIISIRSHPSWGYEPLPRSTREDASIILFPGVRYERPCDAPAEKAKQPRSAKEKPGSSSKRKSRA